MPTHLRHSDATVMSHTETGLELQNTAVFFLPFNKLIFLLRESENSSVNTTFSKETWVLETKFSWKEFAFHA